MLLQGGEQSVARRAADASPARNLDRRQFIGSVKECVEDRNRLADGKCTFGLGFIGPRR